MNKVTNIHDEYCRPQAIKCGRAFWNAQSSQFMYCPTFQFARVPGCENYLFTVFDAHGKEHTFTAESPAASLSPVWASLPEGMVRLVVETSDDDIPKTIAGARTFYKCAPFLGREAYPKQACSYRECAYRAYEYIFAQPFVQHWLLYGTPDVDYDFNVYPSKTISAIIRAMISFGKICPEKKADALCLAQKAADFLISISGKAGTATEYLPPTYYLEFRKNVHGKKLEDFNNEKAPLRLGTIMMIYPPEVALSYIALYNATGEKRFFDAAVRIGEYLVKTIQPCGSWYLQLDEKSGTPLSENYCVPYVFMQFMNELYNVTGDEKWHIAERACYDYMVKTCLETYNWEAQFEDSAISFAYSNLTHFGAHAMMSYILENKKDDKEAMAEAEELLRFIEDQFVVWGNHAPLNHEKSPRQGADKEQWYSPAGLEQYRWYMPIDHSTAYIMEAFLEMYLAKKDERLLEKACTLADMITRMQNEETGLIPTQWMRNTCIDDGGDLWINCMIATAEKMLFMAEVVEK